MPFLWATRRPMGREQATHAIIISLRLWTRGPSEAATPLWLSVHSRPPAPAELIQSAVAAALWAAHSINYPWQAFISNSTAQLVLWSVGAERSGDPALAFGSFTTTSTRRTYPKRRRRCFSLPSLYFDRRVRRLQAAHHISLCRPTILITEFRCSGP